VVVIVVVVIVIVVAVVVVGCNSSFCYVVFNGTTTI